MKGLYSRLPEGGGKRAQIVGILGGYAVQQVHHAAALAESYRHEKARYIIASGSRTHLLPEQTISSFLYSSQG